MAPYVGSPMKGVLAASTAAPEIRVPARQLAETLLARSELLGK
ncbi:MAG: hypothetical protein ABIV50_00710 [Opitutus sp.]